ncbi:hypothetical protein CERSUDRAFT_110467 [Gelatoporia subvermispora B]|uniref:WHIM1 domain-containing protein n=1 Tax=Ceriporiopsis subvermispora (strain B) TaxID=914234 RepID=M2RBU8_CERS8|nr:hypothetical protein CERSUDRAFT_110467 [Gelatoporia subvermispora B]
MKTTASEHSTDKKGHVCPPSNATHPKDRWESLFVYSFICKFTSLRGKVDGLDSPMDLEEALLSSEPNPVMTAILSRFVLNLRPLTRNLSSDVISSTVAGVLQEYFKSSERTVFWDDGKKMNVDPFQSMEGGFFTAGWDLKLQVLRQLVELQLCHSAEIKAVIDRAWGVIHNKHKKIEVTQLPPPPGDPQSQERLQLVPVGQDKERKRYWVIDDSPRVYMSTNPWKITATFQAVSSTRDEYIALVEKLKEIAPPTPKMGERRAKLEQAHLGVLKVLQDRVELIDAELGRIQRAKRKLEQRNMLIAQAEVRETRTRRRTSRPDYAYMNDPMNEDDQDEYTYQEQEDEEYDDEIEYDDMEAFHGEGSTNARWRGRRRSTRASNASSNGRRAADGIHEWGECRGERRSTRLGGAAEVPSDGVRSSRARTEDSTASNHSADGQASVLPGNGGLRVKVRGAAAIKPTETAVEAVAGKKKSKFWYYAVEPVSASQPQTDILPLTDGNSVTSSVADSSRVSVSHDSYSESEEAYSKGRTSSHRDRTTGSSSAASDMDVS